MYKPNSIQVKQFFGGISDSPRKLALTEFQVSKHFDIFSDPGRLIPYRSLETDTETSVSATDLKQYLVRDFLYASASAKLYGLGQTGAGLTKIVQKADATSGLWTLPATSEGNGAVKNGCFVEFKDYLWGFQGTNQLWRWGLLSGTPAITNSQATVASTITSVAQGVIAADANLYLPYNNTLVRIAPGLTITDAVISAPTNFKITSICNFGSYLAIGCAPIASFNGVSKIFIWNLFSDLFSETLELGEGDLRVLEYVDGQLIAIVDRYLNNSIGAGKGSLIISVYGQGSPQLIKEIFTQSLVGKEIPQAKAVKNNRLLFAAKIKTNSAGTTYNEGIWSFGRKNANYPFALTLDVIDENINTSGIQSFNTAGNYFFIAHSSDGSVDKTNDAAVYTFTSLLETQIYDFGDPCLQKNILKFKIYTAPIPTGGSATVKYRIDGATSWTTIGTLSTVGALNRDFYNIESTGDALATFREVEFRLESTGGVEITGYGIEILLLTGSTP
jgi:hypothetical protein